MEIPEGYLLAKPYLDHQESILVYGKKTSDFYTVIKKGRLAAQMVSALATDAERSVKENVGLLEKSRPLEARFRSCFSSLF